MATTARRRTSSASSTATRRSAKNDQRANAPAVAHVRQDTATIDLEMLADKIIERTRLFAADNPNVPAEVAAQHAARMRAPHDYVNSLKGVEGGTSVAFARPASSPIADALDELQCQGNLLHEVISSLEQRLSPVIAARPTAPSGEAGERSGSSTVMGILHERILMVRGARHRIETLLECLEV